MARPAFAPELHHDQLQFADATAQGRAPVFLPAIQRVRFNRAVQRRHEAIPVDRLLDEVVRAAAQAAQREVVLAVACDHQRGRVRPAPQDLGQERETVHARHPDIGDDRVVVPGADPLERRRRRVGRVHRDPAHSEPERSEEHTSELQSPCNLVCRLLLEKNKTQDEAWTKPYLAALPSQHYRRVELDVAGTIWYSIPNPALHALDPAAYRMRLTVYQTVCA